MQQMHLNWNKVNRIVFLFSLLLLSFFFNKQAGWKVKRSPNAKRSSNIKTAKRPAIDPVQICMRANRWKGSTAGGWAHKLTSRLRIRLMATDWWNLCNIRKGMKVVWIQLDSAPSLQLNRTAVPALKRFSGLASSFPNSNKRTLKINWKREEKTSLLRWWAGNECAGWALSALTWPTWCCHLFTTSYPPLPPLASDSSDWPSSTSRAVSIIRLVSIPVLAAEIGKQSPGFSR